MIQLTDKIPNKFLRVGVYVAAPIVLILTWLVIYGLISSVELASNATMGEALSQAMVILFWGAVILIIMFIPYLESLIVLLLRRIMK